MKNNDYIIIEEVPVEKAVEIIEIEKFNPYHDSRGRFASAGGGKFYATPGKSKAHDLAIAREKERQGRKQKVDEDANPEYRYHSTSFKAARSIQDTGLKPSVHAEYGKGVYFAPNVEGTKGWTSEQNETVQLRVKHKTLREKYSYDEFPEQGWTSNKRVAAADIEIKVGEGKWVKIEDADIRDDEVFEW